MTGVDHLAEVGAAIVASWSAETRFASDEYMAAGRQGDPSRGQCGATALVLQDWLGGELLEANVMAGARRLGAHYWNDFRTDPRSI